VAAFGTAGVDNAAAVCGAHALAETVFVTAAAAAWVIGRFHGFLFSLILRHNSFLRMAKVRNILFAKPKTLQQMLGMAFWLVLFLPAGAAGT
jgi:hypothetical protein